MGGLPCCAGIVRQHERKLALSARRGGEACPQRRAARSGGDALCRWLMRDAGEFESCDLALLGLEGDRRGEQPPVELGQHHLHGVIRLGKPARRVLPGFAARSGEHDLQDRRAGSFERRRRIVEARREGGGVEHDLRAPVAQTSTPRSCRCRDP